MRAASWFLVGFLVGSPAFAQEANEALRSNLARNERESQQRASDVERLVDMRMRHDLGLPIEEDPSAPRPPGPVTTESREKLQAEWRDQEAATASMLDRYNKLKEMVEQLQAEAAVRAASQRNDPVLVVPQAGVAPDRRPQNSGDAADGTRAANPGSGEAVEPPAPAVPADALPALDRPRALIQGTGDHLRVAQALYKAGQQLVDEAVRARLANRNEAAFEMDTRAKERLQLALDQLVPLLQAKDPPFAVLFCQGRCRELMFRHAERHEGLSLQKSLIDFQKREAEVREPYLAIIARDIGKQGKRKEIEVTGPWGMAAQSALDHFRWMNEHGRYDATDSIRQVTWPGEQNQ